MPMTRLLPVGQSGDDDGSEEQADCRRDNEQLIQPHQAEVNGIQCLPTDQAARQRDQSPAQGCADPDRGEQNVKSAYPLLVYGTEPGHATGVPFNRHCYLLHARLRMTASKLSGESPLLTNTSAPAESASAL